MFGIRPTIIESRTIEEATARNEVCFTKEQS